MFHLIALLRYKTICKVDYFMSHQPLLSLNSTGIARESGMKVGAAARIKLKWVKQGGDAFDNANLRVLLRKFDPLWIGCCSRR